MCNPAEKRFSQWEWCTRKEVREVRQAAEKMINTDKGLRKWTESSKILVKREYEKHKRKRLITREY